MARIDDMKEQLRADIERELDLLSPAEARHVGFPDLVMARRRAVIIVELKSETGRLQDSQREWFAQMTGDGSSRAPTDIVVTAGASEPQLRLFVTVWRPSDWPQICEVLE